MIAADSSALIAVLLQEPDAQKYADALAEFEDILISTATYVETGIVLDNRQSPLVADEEGREDATRLPAPDLELVLGQGSNL